MQKNGSYLKSSTYYEVLEIDKDASSEEIRKAFYKKVRESHPDKANLGASYSHDKIHLILEAWQALRDEKSKKEYDKYLENSSSANYSGSTFNQMKYTNKISIDNLDIEDGYLCVTCEQCGDVLKLPSDSLTDFNVFECNSCCFRIEI